MPPARIKKITIAGYKSIRQATLELGPLNVLIGANGAGKSNLASLFKLLRSYAQDDVFGATQRAGGASTLLYRGDSQTKKIQTTLIFETAAESVEYEVEFDYTASDQLSVFVGEYPVAANDLALRYMKGSRVYHFHDTTDTARIRQTCEIEDCFELHEDGGNLVAVLYKLQETQPDYFRLIEGTVRLVSPFFGSFALKPNPLNPRTIYLRWRERDSEQEFGCHQLSDGTLRFIALATLLREPPEQLPPLVFVDEPELGLHPAGIAILAALLRKAAFHSQVLVATQSAALLNQFDPEDVVVVDRVDRKATSMPDCLDRSTKFVRLSSTELGEWLEEYTLSELWDKNVLGGRPAR